MNITSEQIQKWVRILVYTAAGALTHDGISVSASAKETAAGIAVILANAAWTMYGDRIMSRINDLQKSGTIANVIVKDKALADAMGPKVLATADVKVVAK